MLLPTGWPFNYNSRKFVEDCLSIGFPVASLDCKLVPSSRVVEFDSTTQLYILRPHLHLLQLHLRLLFLLLHLHLHM